ncbi:MAG: helix-turn-helix transcriptional regulator [Pseudomonadota bacterium]
MKEGPNIAAVAALIGEPARANILSALMQGRALTATELSIEAGVTASTTSVHLGKLEAGGLVRGTKQGRHRYYALSGEETARALEALMGLAQATTGRRVRTGPKDPALRRARVCYDHLAGEMGVALYDCLLARGIIMGDDDQICLTPGGPGLLRDFGLDVPDLLKSRRRLCRPCLDWSMRRTHLAGSLGAAIWDQIQAKGWAKREPDSRAVTFTKVGERAFTQFFRTSPPG